MLTNSNFSGAIFSYFLSAILFLSHSDARIDESVAQIHYDTGQQSDESIEDTIHHKYVVVQQAQRFHIKLTNAGNREYLLDYHGAAKQTHKFGQYGRKYGHEGILQRVARAVACARVRPFVWASSIYSEVNASVSSALTKRV